MHNNSAYQVPSIKPENMHHGVGTLPNAYTNGASHVQPSMQVPVGMLLAQNSNSGIVQGMNGVMIKSEAGYGGDSHFMFGAESNLIESRNGIGEASVSHFAGGESSSQALNESLMEQESTSFGFLGQIPRNFSLSDLTADFSNSTGTLSLSLSQSNKK